MKKRIWIPIVCLILMFALITSAAAEGNVYELVTDVSQLASGDTITIVSDDGANYFAFGPDFSGVQIRISDGTVSEKDGMVRITPEETNGGWLLKTENGYFAVVTGTLSYVSDRADATVFSISVTSSGDAHITCDAGQLAYAEVDGAYRFVCGAGNEVRIYSASFAHVFGDNLFWKYENGKLTIGGEGEMPSDTPWWDRDVREAVILDGVTSVADNAFNWSRDLSKVTLSNTVETIGYRAFSYCDKLKEITIPDSVVSIGAYAFEGSSNLAEIHIGSGVRSVYGLGSWLRNSFYDTAWLNAQPDGPVYLDYVFLGYKGTAAQIVRPKAGTTVIANYAFFQEPIEKAVLPDSVEYIGGSAFGHCSELKDVSFGQNVVSIGENAFYADAKLTSITIPDSVTSIGQNAFAECTGLTDVTLPCNLEVIESSLFYGCTGLTEITVPDKVTRIGVTAFAKCSGLTTVYLSRSVAAIEWKAFEDCDLLTDVYYDGTRSDRERLLTIAESSNPDLMNATWHYLTASVEGTVEWNAEDVKYKGTTAYVIANGSAQTPRFTVKDADGVVIDPAYYDYEYRENTNAGTGYVIVTFKGDYEGTCRGVFKIYLPATTTTTVENVSNGIKLTWSAVAGADGYVIYRRAWSSTTNGWTDFVRWNNTTALNWTDTKVYAGTRYQYGIKAYFNRRVDPVSGATIGGNVGDNYNLGEVGPLKTTVRITTRTLNSVTAGKKQMTVKWSASSVFTGYQIQYATNSAFTQNAKAIKITDPKTAQTVIKNLTKGKTYYVRIRSYHEFNGMTYFGEWSNVKSCKVK